MNQSFCAAIARQTGEDAIGTAEHYQTYVLIECPYPWASNVFESAHIPQVLQQFISDVSSNRSVRFLCIDRGIRRREVSKRVTVLVYDAINPLSVERQLAQEDSLQQDQQQNQSNYVRNSYRGFEFSLDRLEQVPNCLQSYWQGTNCGQPIVDIQDVLICTHGMRDKCCARFGQPFFQATTRWIKQQQYLQVRIWRVSHIGGHRFAPTAIVLPEGRYYAHLTIPALQALLTRTGSIDLLQSVYRGWGLLPKPLQILERRLFLQFGWDWLKCCLSYLIVDEDERGVCAVLIVNSPDGSDITYRAEVMRSRHLSHQIQTSCNPNCPYIPMQYSIIKFSRLSALPAKQPATAINL